MSNIDHWQALFDNSYLRWFDLLGQPALVEIVGVQARVELTLPGGAKARKPVLALSRVQGKVQNDVDDEGKALPTIKPLVLNVTNAGEIAAICGDKPSGWVGQQIVLYETTTRMWDADTRAMVDAPCIRVRAPK